MKHRLEHLKKIYYEFSRSLLQLDSKNLPHIVNQYVHQDLEWNGPAPYKIQKGIDVHLNNFWIPFIEAFPDIEKNPYILLAGEKNGQEWVSATGYFRATFMNDWLGIPHTGRPIYIRFGEWNRIQDDKIIEVYVILDVMDVMRIAGVDLGFPRWASKELALGPATQDGLWIQSENESEAQETLRIVNSMAEGMMDFDGKNLDSMHQWDYWDTERMIWAGPAGIGQTRGLQGYQNYHQGPWLKAFPDRCTHGELHFMPELAQGKYSCGGCWSDWDTVFASHTGGDLLGLAATNKVMRLRDYDWYRVENGKIIENWCMIDNIHLMEQLGINIFERMNKMLNRNLFNIQGEHNESNRTKT